MFNSLLVILILIVFPLNAFAHGGGGDSFLEINGETTGEYYVPSSSSSDFILPQDSAKRNFLVGQELSFEIDTAALPIPGERIRLTNFTSYFGDGGSGIGLNLTHKYSNPGTYFMKLEATTEGIAESQLLQSTAINILPNENYKLPKAVIKINNEQSKDPLLDIIEVNFDKEILFDASGSDAGDSEITEYFWDLGDGNLKNGKTFKYKYGENPYIVFPVLRIKTKEGFISDSYVQLSDANSNFESGNSNPFSNIFDWKVVAISAFASLILTGIIFLIFRKYFNAKRQ